MTFLLTQSLRQPPLTTPPHPGGLWLAYPDSALRPSIRQQLPCAVESDTSRLLRLMTCRRRIRQGERIYREGDHFQFLYAVQSGSFKSTLALADGFEQVGNFHMTGEVLGLDGVAEAHHASSATALEDSEVSSLPYAALSELCVAAGGVQGAMLRLISREVVRCNAHSVLLGSLNSTQRVASFLLNQSQRLQVRGYSAVEFHLKMTRGEIGSFLGMTLETVSRTFTELQQQRLLQVERRHIVITNLERLAQV